MKQQLELNFDRTVHFRMPARRQRRLGVARWWFDQMRQAVDAATDWHPAPPARPEQTRLSLLAVRQ